MDSVNDAEFSKSTAATSLSSSSDSPNDSSKIDSLTLRKSVSSILDSLACGIAALICFATVSTVVAIVVRREQNLANKIIVQWLTKRELSNFMS